MNSLSVVYQALHSDNFGLHYCYSLEKQQNLWCNVYVLVSYMINEVKQVVLLVLHLESNHRKRKNNTEKNPCKVNVYVCISLWRAKNVIENSASSLSEYCFDRVLFWHWNNIACLFQCSRDVNHHWITSRIVSNSAFFFQGSLGSIFYSQVFECSFLLNLVLGLLCILLRVMTWSLYLRACRDVAHAIRPTFDISDEAYAKYVIYI